MENKDMFCLNEAGARVELMEKVFGVMRKYHLDLEDIIMMLDYLSKDILEEMKANEDK